MHFGPSPLSILARAPHHPTTFLTWIILAECMRCTSAARAVPIEYLPRSSCRRGKSSAARSWGDQRGVGVKGRDSEGQV